MIRKLSISWLFGLVGLMAAEPSDLLRFTNGDQLHGTFFGIKSGPQAIWQREDLTGTVDFKTSRIRHIVLHGGRALKSLTSISHVALVDGDRMPGLIRSLDEENVTLDTPYAGVVRIPRNQVAMLAPSPLGGRIQYYGPFVEDEWQMANASFPNGFSAPASETASQDGDAKDVPGRWTFSGSAWYWQSKRSGTAILRKEVMPDRAILRFELAWKNRLSIAIGFHADFAHPKPVKEAGEPENDAGGKAVKFVPGDSAVLPVIFGNSYVLHVFSSHLMLYRTSVNGDGVASIGRVLVNANNVRLSDSGNATMEIRSNRNTGQISLFINDEFAAQWTDGGDGGAALPALSTKGSGFGFVVQSENSPVRLSDVMVAEWNGMPDSARSLQVDDQDIVLLSNGVDRFSGDVKSLKDGKILLETKHGDFQFPLEEIAEIRFARNRLASKTEELADSIVIRLSPLGQVTGRPLSGNSSALKILHPFAGELDFNLESAVMLDFHPSTNSIDDWNTDF